MLPEELAAPVLTLEGEQFPITGGVQGADGPGNSFVYIPSLKAVVTGDIVFDHVVLRRAARRGAGELAEDDRSDRGAQARRSSIPGHEGPGATHDMKADRLDEEVHRRLGRERRAIEGRRRRCGRTCSDSIRAWAWSSR